MRKTLRRSIAVIVLIVTVMLVGYSCYTGKRSAGYPDTLDCYKRYIFRSKDGSMVAFMDEDVWYGVGDEPMILLKINEYQEGVITMQREAESYEFVAIDSVTIYDVQTKTLLVRRGDD